MAEIEKLLKCAKKGDLEAQYQVGCIYSKEKAFSDEGFNWLKKAAKNGYVLAQLKVAEMYMEGSGVSEDERKALDWFEKAAEQGNQLAQYYLALMYMEGRGTTQDFQKFFKWFKRAAEDETVPIGVLINVYTLGVQEIEKDNSTHLARLSGEIFKWATKMANNGNPNAQWFLVEIYEKGIDVPQDYQKALSWAEKIPAPQETIERLYIAAQNS